MITPVKIVNPADLVDFVKGPFSDEIKYPYAMRRVICRRVLHELVKTPEVNAVTIVKVNEVLERLG